MHNYQQKKCVIFSNVLKSYKAGFCCLCRGCWNVLTFRCKQLKYNPKFTFLEYINFSLIFKKYGFFRKKPWLSGEIVVKYKALQLLYADMAELADAHGSGPCESNFMEVQVLLSAPYWVFLQNSKGFVWHSVFYWLFNLHKRQNEHLRPVLYVPKHCFRVAFQGRVFQYCLCSYSELWAAERFYRQSFRIDVLRFFNQFV